MIFFSLFSTAFSSVFYGIVVTVTVMALLYFALKSVSKGIVRTPVFYVTGIVLAVLLAIQQALLIGAIEAKDAADAGNGDVEVDVRPVGVGKVVVVLIFPASRPATRYFTTRIMSRIIRNRTTRGSIADNHEIY